MLIVIIPIRSHDEALALMQQASGADIFEFRLDYLPQIDIALIQSLQKTAQKPVLFTLRKAQQGGFFTQDEATRLALLEKLMTLQPDYIDIEHDVPLSFCQKLKTIEPQVAMIRSYHNFIDTPEDLPHLLRNMVSPIFYAYKIITTAQSILDSLHVLHFVKEHSAQYPLIAHAMGELGITSRILGKVCGNYFTYATVVAEDIAPGLLNLDEWVRIYHYPQLNQHTQIYGLIGYPVAQSIGHQFHNAEFIKHQQNAVYVKFEVKPEELADFFHAIKGLPIAGLSVTMPHKQAVLSFCKTLTPEVEIIGAANTLIRQDDSYLAANTDGDAVIQALPIEVKNKQVIVLGAGGAASSIIYSLIKAGSKVTVYNRTQDKLDILCKKYPINTVALKELAHADYDILINTIPAQFYSPEFIKSLFHPDKIVMDANYQSTPTAFIKDAQTHGCVCIDGYAMFYAQAELQRQLWFKHDE